MDYQFTRQDFFRELHNLRELMGSKIFWAKTPEIRDQAIKGFGFVYTNADLQPEDISLFCATMEEYSRRETMMVFRFISQ